jgi:hypothetical protein
LPPAPSWKAPLHVAEGVHQFSSTMGLAAGHSTRGAAPSAAAGRRHGGEGQAERTPAGEDEAAT